MAAAERDVEPKREVRDFVANERDKGDRIRL